MTNAVKLCESMDQSDGWVLSRRLAAVATEACGLVLDSEWQLWLLMQVDMEPVGTPILAYSYTFESGDLLAAGRARAEMARAELVLKGVVLFLNAGGDCVELLRSLAGVAAARPEPVNLNGFDFVDAYDFSDTGGDLELVFVEPETDSAIIWSPGRSLDYGSARLWLATIEDARLAGVELPDLEVESPDDAGVAVVSVE